MQHNLHLFNKLCNLWPIHNQDLNKTAITETKSSRLRKPATEKPTQKCPRAAPGPRIFRERQLPLLTEGMEMVRLCGKSVKGRSEMVPLKRYLQQ